MMRMLLEIRNAKAYTRCNVLLVLDLLRVILQEPYDRALLQLSGGHDVVRSYTVLAWVVAKLGVSYW